jgi:hypothetical protein
MMSTDVSPSAESSPQLDLALPSSVSVLQAMIAELRQALSDRDQRVSELQQAIDALVRRLQRTPHDAWPADQPALFPEAHPQASQNAAPVETVPPPEPPQIIEPETKKRKKHKHGRRSLEELLKTLPLERREHPLTEAERLCPCCGRKRCKMGEQTSQQLEYIPAKLICIQHVQFTYSCPHCPEHIRTAPKPPQPIDRGLAGPGLLAVVIANKFDD